jgi:hypothetical protein
MTQIKRRLVVVAPTIKDVYDSEELYQRMAIVTNSTLTAGYMSKIDNNTGNPLSDEDAWMKLYDLVPAVEEATRKEIVIKTAEDTTPTLAQNKMYEFPEMEILDITLATPVMNELNEYQFSFDSGSTATTFSVPAGVVWTSAVTIEANMHYECNIMYNQTDHTYYGIIVGWSLPTT